MKKIKKLIIACDGESASGKSTASKLISKKYKLLLINSGLLYRYASKLIIKHKPKNQITFVKNKFKNISYTKISKQNLHSEHISNHVADLAKIKKIREIINKVQISIIRKNKRICVEGRDIASKIFECGVEKIAINYSAINNPSLITKIANKFGSQSIVISIDIKYDYFGRRKIYSHTKKKNISLDPLQWAHTVEELGAGEILLTCVNNEGMWNGLDINLIKYFSSYLKIPVIAHGGAFSLDNISRAIKDGGANAVAVGNMFVYQKKGMGVLVNYPSEFELKKVTSDKSI